MSVFFHTTPPSSDRKDGRSRNLPRLLHLAGANTHPLAEGRPRTTGDLSTAVWRKSSFSDAGGNCVEIASLPDAVAVRDSKNPHPEALLFSRTAAPAWIEHCKAGKFDITAP